MASAPDLRNHFTNLIKSTLRHFEEVVVKKSKEGKLKLDLALLRRKRREALAELGEVTLKLVLMGRLDEEEFPELSSPLSQIEALDEEIATEEMHVHGGTGADAALPSRKSMAPDLRSAMTPQSSSDESPPPHQVPTDSAHATKLPASEDAKAAKPPARPRARTKKK